MTFREQAEYMAAHDGECDGIICSECFRDGRCDGGDVGAFRDSKQWLADHPEIPTESERYYKGATRGDTTYSLSLSAGRLSLFRWHGEDSESMDFGGTVADFNQFDDERPEEWFDVAAKMIGERK